MNSSPRLLVGTDGSPASERAVRWTADFARTTAADVILVHVVSTVVEWVLSAVQIDFVGVEKEHQELLETTWSDPLRAAGVPVRTLLRRGDAAKVLNEVAEHEEADLVIVGQAGRGAIGVPRLGGVTLRLAHHTTRPLVIVPTRAGPSPARSPSVAGGAER